ncbi:MAG: hypothetical protein JJT88_09275 [Gammaproteobacteria bacterium]|nr:hypothetical protein [Gammaproteobacteria bacterium]
MTEGLQILTLQLMLAPILVAVYGVFYGLMVAAEQRGQPGNIPAAVYTFGKLCWGTSLLLTIVVLDAVVLAISGALPTRVYFLLGVYTILAVTFVLLNVKTVHWRDPSR